MKIETYDELVQMIRTNALYNLLEDFEYYTGDATSERTNEALNIVFEFVMAVPELHKLIVEQFSETEDQQMLQLWFMDDVIIEFKDTIVVVEVPEL